MRSLVPPDRSPAGAHAPLLGQQITETLVQVTAINFLHHNSAPYRLRLLFNMFNEQLNMQRISSIKGCDPNASAMEFYADRDRACHSFEENDRQTLHNCLAND
jgi:hypothetical protein